MTIGYARVSAQDQNLDLQLDELQRQGCEKIFEEKESGAGTRPAFDRMIAQLQPGDLLIVRDIDQMGRSLVEIIQTVDRLVTMKVQFRSTSQPFVDTLSDSGEFIFKFIAMLADQERKRLSRRTKAGLAAARVRGKKGGRPAGIGARLLKKASTAEVLYKARTQSVAEIARQLGISKGSLYKLLRHQGVQVGQSETEA